MKPPSTPNGSDSGGFQPAGDNINPEWRPLEDAASGALASHGPRKRRSLFARFPALRWVIDTVAIVAGAVVIAVLLRMFVVQVYQIPSASMTDTLTVGSRIAVNRLPVLGTQIDRGDVVVFEDELGWLPSLTDQDRSGAVRVGEFLGIVPAGGEQVLVKRVIGVGGDTVECCGPSGKLLVNGIEISEPYVGLGGGSQMPSFKVTVPEGSLWVMGDNRANSADSLFHYLESDDGFVSEDAVIGRAVWKIWPLNQWSYLGNREAFEDVS